jgi:hypothetical protein
MREPRCNSRGRQLLPLQLGEQKEEKNLKARKGGLMAVGLRSLIR